MWTGIVCFLIGLMIGANVGLFFFAMCSAARQADDERIELERQKRLSRILDR